MGVWPIEKGPFATNYGKLSLVFFSLAKTTREFGCVLFEESDPPTCVGFQSGFSLKPPKKRYRASTKDRLIWREWNIGRRCVPLVNGAQNQSKPAASGCVFCFVFFLDTCFCGSKGKNKFHVGGIP